MRFAERVSKNDYGRQAVTSENPVRMSLGFLDISEVQEGDELRAVKFECGSCGREFITLPIGENEGIQQTADICERRCSEPDCEKLTGFNFLMEADKNAKTKSAGWQERKLAQERLCKLLAGGLKRPTPEKCMEIQELMNDRNLRLRVEVMRV
jgi:hypothetical protein